MADVPFDRIAYDFVISLRRTIELPYQAMVRQQDHVAAEAFRELLKDVEGLRLAILPLRRAIRETQFADPRQFADFASLLARLSSNPSNSQILSSLPFRHAPPPPPSNRTTDYIKLIVFSGRDRPTLAEAIQSYLDWLGDHIAPSQDSPTQQDLFRLRALVPSQKIAPAQFQIVGQRLTLRRFSSVAHPEDESNVRTALHELQTSGGRILDELRRSNCDKRLLEQIQKLQDELTGEVNAIRVGLANLGCEIMSAAYEDELPAAVASMLAAHTRGVQLFVGQFPEWNKFIENASAAELHTSDIANVQHASATLIAELEAKPDFVDAEVPRTLRYLEQFVRNPAQSSKKAAFAVLRSIENLISLVFTYSADFAQKTITKTIDDASAAASKLIVRSLLGIALISASSLTPVADKLPDMKWLRSAAEIVQKQIERLQ